MKTCRVCKTMKALADFFRHAHQPDGHTNICKSCVRAARIAPAFPAALRVRELLHYEPVTGVFTWRKSQGKASAGRVAGTVSRGYLVIRIDGRLCRANRLAWVYMTGEEPHGVVDHKNTDSFDNSWDNLRDVTHQVNNQNRRRASPGTASGILGVYPLGARWTSKISIDNRSKHLGCFDTAALAYDAYVAAKRQFHEGCTL